jgi:hypothetical protein
VTAIDVRGDNADWDVLEDEPEGDCNIQESWNKPFVSM